MCILTLLLGLSAITTLDVFGQTDHIQSPKKQLESGVEPHEVVCRDDLVLAVRSNGNIACAKHSIAEKFNWEIIATSFSDNDKTEKNTTNSRDGKNTLNDNGKTQEPAIPWQDDIGPYDGIPKRLSGFIDPQHGIVPLGSIKSVIQIPEKDAELTANRISEILNDKITHRDGARYITDRGSILLSSTGENISSFSYVGRTNGIISYEKAEQIAQKLIELFGIPLDGTEFVNNHMNPNGEYYFIYIQQKDDLHIVNSMMRLMLAAGITQILIDSWLEDTSELELYDPNKLPEISMSYAKQFEVLAEPPCSISNRGLSNQPLSLKFINGTLVYISYAGSCQHHYEFLNPSFYTYIDAITGEPLFIKRGMSY